ncbi:uncharacterized protein JCM6883_005350 [Sporobolomyces salmoneus]|uniref:uncharacterized protein n=1 Tax=Sporobolomyces salmoneus TaxID=183962 RepID=UPI00317D0CDF
MPPRIFLLRHGEAQHNVGPPPPPDHDLVDPELTSRGVTQCTSIANTYPNFFQSLSPSDTLIVVSPLRRTIQTFLLAFSAFLPTTTTSDEDSIPHMLLPELQECGSWPCDTGDDLDKTKERFKAADFLDWSTVESKPDWNKNRGVFETTEKKNVARAKWVRQWLKSRPEGKIVVVTHHGLLRRLTKAPNAHNRQLTPTHLQWSNAELREYKFKDEDEDDEEADLVQVKDSVL